MAVDDVIKAARNMARTTGQVLDNSKTATKALNKIVSDHGTALNNARKIVGSNTATKALNEIVSDHGTALNNARKIVDSNTSTKALNKIVNEHGTALNNAKKIANANTSVPSRYDAKGNYEQALKKAKEIANGNTTTKAINNVPRTSEMQPRMPIIDTSMPNGGPQASPIIKNTPIDNTANSGPKYGPRKDSIPNDDGPWQNNFDFSDDGGPRTNSSGGGNGNKNTNSNTNTNSGPEGGPNSGGGNEGRSWKDYANDYFGGIGDTYRSVKDGGNFWDALQSAHTNDDGSLRWGRIAGTYAAAAVGSRIISGGGLYKDRYGNSNIPGVPFI